MTDLRPEAFFSLEEFGLEDLFFGVEKVWEVLSRLPDYLTKKVIGKVIETGSIIHSYHCFIGENFYLGHSVQVQIGAEIDAQVGPIWIGQGSKILSGARIRGPVIIGKSCQISGEVKSSIILNGAHSDHQPNYIGDSIVGRNCRIGCGTVLSNRRFDRNEVIVHVEGEKIPTGLHRLGAILGDEVKTGCNSVIGPGALIGPTTWIGQAALVRNQYIPPNMVIQVQQNQRITTRKPDQS